MDIFVHILSSSEKMKYTKQEFTKMLAKNLQKVIGEGDADESTGYIGEYAEKWNQQLRKEKKS